MASKTPKCQHCGQDMARLPKLTEKKKLPVYVCATKAAKAKQPCDGPAYEFATRNK